MGKDKLKKFAENKTFRCLVQPEFDEIFGKDHPLKGRWHADFFRNDRPIVLELGCGKGEYTVALAADDPARNYIGVDIKGARMWRGAKTATEQGMDNVGFLRTRIEFITSFFAPGEVSELWITFPDPQLKTRACQETSHRTALSGLLCAAARTGRLDQPQNRLAAPLPLYGRGNPPLRTALRGLESRHLRYGIRRQGAFDQDGLRTDVSRSRPADHLYPLYAGRHRALRLVRLGGGRQAQMREGLRGGAQEVNAAEWAGGLRVRRLSVRRGAQGRLPAVLLKR